MAAGHAGLLDSKACKTLFLHWGCGKVSFLAAHCCEYVRIFIGEAVEVPATLHRTHDAAAKIAAWLSHLCGAATNVRCHHHRRETLPLLLDEIARTVSRAPPVRAARRRLALSVAVAATTEAELNDYFAHPHPEFAVALIIHWILWGKFDRRIALAYDFGGLVLFAAEPFFAIAGKCGVGIAPEQHPSPFLPLRDTAAGE